MRCLWISSRSSTSDVIMRVTAANGELRFLSLYISSLAFMKSANRDAQRAGP
jgi:hypothetical protein